MDLWLTGSSSRDALVTISAPRGSVLVHISLPQRGVSFNSGRGRLIRCGPAYPRLGAVPNIKINDDIHYPSGHGSWFFIDESSGKLSNHGDQIDVYVDTNYEVVAAGLMVRGTRGDDAYRFGRVSDRFTLRSGADLNDNGDVDVSIAADAIYASGGPGRDFLSVQGGNGAFRGIADIGAGMLLGGPGSDRLLAGRTNVSHVSNRKSFLVDGGAGSDQLRGTNGGETLDGGPGNDILADGDGNDSVRGGPGRDTVTYRGASGAVDVDLGIVGRRQWSSAAGRNVYGDYIENLVGSRYSDRLRGNHLANWIMARDGRRDRIGCSGSRRDRVSADFRDAISGCEYAG